MTARSAARLAVRDLQASWRKFIFVIFAVAAGTGALTGVRGFSESFGSLLFREARTLIASDLFVRIFAQPTPEQQAAVDALTREGIRYTPVTETVSMAASAATPDPALVTLKAIDPAVFPFYGSVQLAPALSLAEALAGHQAVVSDDLLLRLNVKQGGTVRLGGKDFRVSAVLVSEPDRMSGSFSVGPRVLISRESLEGTGLVGLGSRASQRLLFRTGNQDLSMVEARLRKAFPEALVVNYREMNPNVSRGISRTATFLSMVSLIALVIGAIGVAAAMHAHLQSRMDSIAILKSIGAKSRDVVAIYGLQTTLLGLVGGLAGVVTGQAVQAVLPALFGRFLPIQPPLTFSFQVAVQGLALGMLTTALFTLPALLSVREIRPAMIFRRDMAANRTSLRTRLRKSTFSAAIALTVCLGLAGVAATLVSGPPIDAIRIGTVFVAGLLVSLAAMFAASAAMTASKRKDAPK